MTAIGRRPPGIPEGSAAPDPSASELAPLLASFDALSERACSVTDIALAMLERGQIEPLFDTLHLRDRLNGEIRNVVTRLVMANGLERSRSTGGDAGAADPRWARFSEQVARLRDHENLLAERLLAARNVMAEELARVGLDSSAALAYDRSTDARRVDLHG